MDRSLLVAIVLTMAFIHSCRDAAAQRAGWAKESHIGLVFRISNREAQELLTRRRSDAAMERYLHTQIDTFNVRHGWKRKPQEGHFLLVRAIENKLHCVYTGVLPYQVFLLKEYDALALQVLDRAGNVRTDAKVRYRKSRVALDTATNTFRMGSDEFYGSTQFVSVELDGFRSFFEVTKRERPYWAPSYYHNDAPQFYSYMITDKNRYRPGEKVRFKSYALSHNRIPIQKPLDLWLDGNGRATKIGAVSPYRPGGFSGELILHDSLRIMLDKTYRIFLRDKRGRIVAQCSFLYEDYELSRDKLEIDLKLKEQYNPDSNILKIKAVDVNGLPVLEGRVNVVVTPESIRESFQRVLYVPDTLLYVEQTLNDGGELTIPIPPAIFHRANMTYRVDVTLISNNQQQLKQSVNATYYYNGYSIDARLSRDSVVYSFRENGRDSVCANAVLVYDDLRDTRIVSLPFREKVNPNVRMVTVKCGSISRIIDMASVPPSIGIMGGIERDSFKVWLDNPHQVEGTWFIYQGSELLEKGFGKQMRHQSVIEDRSRSYYVEWLYTYAGEERIRQREYRFNDKQLIVDLALPDRVYPGQTVDASVSVTNQAGQPVGGVDLTALGVNSKLDYTTPPLSDYGTLSARRDAPATFDKRAATERQTVINLDYKRWSKRMGLDTMKYYQLLYPGHAIYRNSSPIQDSTQFSIYVMRNGMARQIYVVEVNRTPVYFSWTEPARYSFYADPSRLNEITVRLWDRVLIVDSVRLDRHQKTIISVDLDHLPEGVRQIMLYVPSRVFWKKSSGYPTFTPIETGRYSTRLAMFRDLDYPSYLISKEGFLPLITSRDTRQITAGPVRGVTQTLVTPTYSLQYKFSGGGIYSFENNVVYFERSNALFPTRLENKTASPFASLADLAWTKAEFLARSVDRPLPWLTQRIDAADHNSRLTIVLPKDSVRSGVRTVLFQDIKSGIITEACTGSRTGNSIYLLPRGSKHLIVLYNNGTYLREENVVFRSHQHAWVDFSATPFHKADSLSSSWMTRNNGGCLSVTDPVTTSVRQFLRPRRTYGATTWGTVLDDTGAAMPGVNVVLKNTKYGTVTDVNGNFVLEMDGLYGELVFSFIGYVSREVEVQAGSMLTVQMETDVTSLDEIVVVGYGVQIRGLSSYSVSRALSGRVASISVNGFDETRLQAKEDMVEEDIAGQQLYEELLTLQNVRSKFNDVAFWEPKLYTDRKGRVNFSITFPDDITRWDAVVYAMNRRLQTGISRKSVRSFKPIMAELDVPRFLVRGDSVLAHGNVVNHSGRAEIDGIVSWKMQSMSLDSAVKFGKRFYRSLPLTTMSDSVTASYLFTGSDGYVDGEQRTIPVIEQGTLIAEGSMRSFGQGDNASFVAAPNQQMVVELLGSPLDLCVMEARYLIDYKYACNEQLASKLMGLLAFRNAMSYEQKKFRYDDDVRKIIERLLKNQNEEFLWSWWDVSPETSRWISAHILRALKTARDAGYTVDLNLANLAARASYKFDVLSSLHHSDIDLLQSLAAWGVKLNYPSYLTRMDTIISAEERRFNKVSYPLRSSLLREKLLLLEVRQLTGQGYDSDLLLKHKKEGMRGDIFFSDEHVTRGWFNDELAINSIAYRVVRRDSSLHDLMLPMQMYFLNERRKGQWNTYQAGNLLLSVLPDIQSMGATQKNPYTINVEGRETTTVTQLPFRIDLQPGENVKVEHVKGMPVYLMHYTKERVRYARRGGDGFEIATVLGNGGMLEKGRMVKMKVDVTVRKDASAEYVMIEVPIPAACSYTDSRQKAYRNETHREYFKDRINIYFERMDEGHYTFEFALLPRFAGKFYVNPAQISLMYAPVINANTSIGTVMVQE